MTSTPEETKAKRKLSTTPDTAPADAREQADAYESVFGHQPLELDNGEILMIPPHPDYAMLDDDAMEEWEQYQYDIDTLYDREPDTHVPEQNLDNGLKLSAETIRGAIKRPFRITTKDDDGNEVTTLIKPAHSVKVVQISLGDELYAKLKAGGRNAADVWKVWGRQNMAIKERQQRDSKSARGVVDLAPVPEADS